MAENLEGCAMKLKTIVIAFGCVVLTSVGGGLSLTWAQGRGLGPAPQTGRVVAIRAGRLFDPKLGANVRNQIILITGDRITDVGPNVPIPVGATVIDLS